jgi:MarR family 2-MHQ and catechol resistance regulon transcriptional repressor
MIGMALLTDPDEALITTFGRVIEASSALGQQLGRSLERQCGIPHTWFEVLLRISRAEGGRISMGSLAQQVALTTGGITRLLDRMIAADLVQRVPSPTDRRVHLAALTEAGRAKLADATAVHAANLRRAFAGFTAEDLRTFDDLLDRLRTARIGDAP